MSWSIDVGNLPSIHSYESAAKFFNESTAFRGTPYEAPLAERRDRTKRIVIREESYQLCFHDTPLVTYHADGEVDVRAYPSASSRAFLGRVGPRGVYQIAQGNNEFLFVNGVYHLTSGSRSPVRLKKDDAGVFRMTSAPKPGEEYAGNLKAMAAVRKKLAPFEMWQKTGQRMKIEAAQFPAPWKIDRNFSRKELCTALLEKTDNMGMYPLVVSAFSNLKEIRDEAYLISGARYKVDAPTHRLPLRNRS